MRFEEALFQFKNELYREYSIQDGVVKIALSYELYDAIARSDYFHPENTFIFKPSAISDNRCLGITIVARQAAKEI